MEEIDDDLEAVGYIEVVKSDDRNVAKELGIKTFPSLVYFRRRNPILYDGMFSICCIMQVICYEYVQYA